MSYIPILFNETTTNYNNNGIAMLSDTLDYYVVEGRNDIFELTLEYPASGKWASELKDWRQILAKPNEKDDPHVFRITEIVKELNPSTIYVYATSITNDLGGNLVVELEPKNLNGQQVMDALKANLLNDNRFNFISDIQTRSSTYWYMRNPLNCLVGGEGSFVQYWGGEVKRTNDTIYVYSRRGRDNVTVLRPDKNIEGFTITTSTSSVVTRILPYFSYYSNGDNPQEIVVIGDVVESPLASNYPIQRIVPVDFTGDEAIVDAASLMTKASKYFTTLYPDIDKPDVQIEIDMMQLSDSALYSKFKGLEQINLTDTITVWIEKYNIDMVVKVVELTYNGMSGRTISLVAGAKAASLYEAQKGEYSSQINNLQKYISTVENGIINVIQESADGKNRIFRGYTEPSPDISKENDLWFKEIGNGEVEVYTFDGMTWQPMLFAGLGAEIRAQVEEALQKSEEAKQAAEQSYADSVAEAARLLQIQTDAFNAQMSDVHQEISTITTNVETNLTNVNLAIANNFTSLSDSISDVNDIAVQAKTDASGALGIVSNVNTTVNQLNGEIGTLITRVDDNGVLINQVKSTADGTLQTVANHAGRLTTIETNVSGLQVSVADKVSNAQFTVLSNSVSSVVSDLNNLEIGGRNLAHSENINYRYGTLTSNSTKNISGKGNWFIDIQAGFLPNTTYTISNKKIINQNSYGENLAILIYNDAIGSLVQTVGSFSSGGVRTFTTSSNVKETDRMLIYVSDGTTSGSFEIHELKLEKGNKATDWTPAPEDMATQSQITQLSTDINLRVSKGDVVSQINIEAGRTLISSSKLLLDANTYIMGTTFANDVKAKSLDAITANITSIRSQVLVTDSITSTHIKAENALIDGIFGTTALITRLTSKDAFINNIKAIEISASKITTGTLNAANVNITNLNVSKIVGLNSEFIQSAWNGINASVSISADGIVSIGSDGDKTKIRNGLAQFWNNSNNLTGSIGTSYRTLDAAKTGVAVFLEYGKAFSVNRKASYDSISYAQLMSFPADHSQMDLRVGLSMHSNDIVNAGKITVQNGIEMSKTSISNAWQVTFVNSTYGVGRVGPMSNSNDLGVHSSGLLYLGVNGSGVYSSPLVVGREEVRLNNTLKMNKQVIQDVWSLKFRNSSAEYGSLVNVSGTNDLAVIGAGTVYLGVGSSTGFTTTMIIAKELINAYWNINMNGKSVTGTSDARLKTNITPTDVIAIDHFRQFDFVDYNWIDTNMSHDRQFGLLAQDTPFISLYDKSNDLWLLDSSKQTMLNSLGIKELVSITDKHTSDILRIDTFTTQHELEIKLLKDRITQLEEQLA